MARLRRLPVVIHRLNKAGHRNRAPTHMGPTVPIPRRLTVITR